MRSPGLVVLASFLLAATAGSASATLPFVTHVSTSPDPACAGLATTLVIDGLLPNGCGEVLGTEQFGAERVVVTLRPHAAADTVCSQSLQPWRRVFNLGDLPAGPRSVDVEIRVVPVNANDPPQIVVEPFPFTVQASCGTDSLPYVGSIGVTAAPPCNPATVVPCPGDSLGVCIRGTFPNDCFRLVSVELLPSPIAGPRPEPPIVRLVVDDGACSGRACVLGRFPWQATATLPPLPSGSYGLHVELALVSCTDIDSSLVHRTIVPFNVLDCGPPEVPCLRAGFLRSFDARICDAQVSPGQSIVVGFGLESNVSLAGLEGQFDLQPSGLRIVGVEAVGPAAGLQLNWSPTPSGGAHFVLFADDPGEVIPGGRPPESAEILRLRVGAPAGTTLPDQTFLRWSSLLGADANGAGVPECPTRATDERLRSFILCAPRPCDLNHDGVLDVRDLVLMVNCLNGFGLCTGQGDCNGDSAFTLDDVICCATKLLREHCPGCPADTSGRPEPGIGMTFGAPVFGEHGVDVPLRIHGAERIGGAKLTLRVPTDRYDVSPELIDPNHRWLHLHQVGDGELTVGLILTAAESTPGPEVLDLTLHFQEKSGRPPGGMVALEGADLSGVDGVRLIVDAGRPQVDLGGAPHLVLGESRPNPTTGVARFTVVLDRPGSVDVAIYDVSGRRVVTLLSGPQGVGTREVQWDGRASDGREMPGGLYFYRGSAGGQVVARKLVLLRGQ